MGKLTLVADPMLAAQFTRSGLIDEYALYYVPVVLGRWQADVHRCRGATGNGPDRKPQICLRHYIPALCPSGRAAIDLR